MWYGKNSYFCLPFSKVTKIWWIVIFLLFWEYVGSSLRANRAFIWESEFCDENWEWRFGFQYVAPLCWCLCILLVDVRQVLHTYFLESCCKSEAGNKIWHLELDWRIKNDKTFGWVNTWFFWKKIYFFFSLFSLSKRSNFSHSSLCKRSNLLFLFQSFIICVNVPVYSECILVLISINGFNFYQPNLYIGFFLLTVHNLQQGNGPHCMAVFSILSSPICTLQFANSGNRLAVGFECGQVKIFIIIIFLFLFLDLVPCISNILILGLEKS